MRSSWKGSAVPDDAEEAWRLGHAAGLDEVGLDANPFEASRELADNWADGWRVGTNTINRSGDDQAWAEWRAVADPGEPEHSDAP
jgi:hypothetical protein